MHTHALTHPQQIPSDSLAAPSSGHTCRPRRCNPSCTFSHFLLLSTFFRHRILSGPRSALAAVCSRLWFLPVSEDAAGQCARLSPAVRRAAPRGGRLLRNSEGKPIWTRVSASKRLVPASHLRKVSLEFSARARSAVTRSKTRF